MSNLLVPPFWNNVISIIAVFPHQLNLMQPTEFSMPFPNGGEWIALEKKHRHSLILALLAGWLAGWLCNELYQLFQ
jgi:hypothetical protein